MQDLFYEESTTLINEKVEQKKYNLVKFASIFTIFLIVFWVYFDFNFLDLSNLFVVITAGILPIVIFVVFALVLGKIKDKFCVVYDYTFITGSIRISKVIRNTKRKSVIKFECSEIEKIGKIDSELYNSYLNQIHNGLEFICATSNHVPLDGKNFYYVVVNALGKKTLIKLECNKELIMNIIKFSKRTIIDGELLK